MAPQLQILTPEVIIKPQTNFFQSRNVLLNFKTSISPHLTGYSHMDPFDQGFGVSTAVGTGQPQKGYENWIEEGSLW